MNLHPAGSIVNEARLPEFIHEKVDPRSGRAYHLCEGFLADRLDYSFRHAFLAKTRKREKNSSQAFLAGIEELVNQIVLPADVPRQQIG